MATSRDQSCVVNMVLGETCDEDQVNAVYHDQKYENNNTNVVQEQLDILVISGHKVTQAETRGEILKHLCPFCESKMDFRGDGNDTFHCMTPWHEGMTCGEYKSNQDNTCIKEWAISEEPPGKRNAQMCPNCKVSIPFFTNILLNSYLCICGCNFCLHPCQEHVRYDWGKNPGQMTREKLLYPEANSFSPLI